MPSEDTVRVRTDQIPVWSTLEHPLCDEQGHQLLAAGASFTAAIRDRLLQRGTQQVCLELEDAIALGLANRHREPDPVSGVQLEEIRKKLDALASSASLLVENSGPPLSQRVVARGSTPYDFQQRQRLASCFSATQELLDNAVQQALAGMLNDTRPLEAATSQYIDELVEDTDSVITSSIELAHSPQVTERGIRVAVLSMAIAIDCGYDEANSQEVGLCGLMHDWGTFQLAEKIRNPRANLSEKEWGVYAQHPLFTAELLEKTTSLSHEVRLATTQAHESLDGSGYPCGLKKEQIHPFARILQVADAYTTLTAEMRGRMAYRPYDVMVYMLHQAKTKRMDEKMVRSLLNVVSLFPIGSHVRLSDGSEAQVIRRSGNDYTSPIVQRVGSDRKIRKDAAHDSILDLASCSTRVMTPLNTPDRQEARLEKDLMEKILWEGSIG